MLRQLVPDNKNKSRDELNSNSSASLLIDRTQTQGDNDTELLHRSVVAEKYYGKSNVATPNVAKDQLRKVALVRNKTG